MKRRTMALVLAGSGLALASLLAATAAQAGPTGPAEKVVKMVTTPSGLQYADLKVGKGDEATAGKLVMVNYDAWLPDGTKFDSSYARREPFKFKVGAGEVIQGWDQGVVGMRVGGKRKLVIPGSLAYGEQGVPGRIPPNATLTFEVELLEVQ